MATFNAKGIEGLELSMEQFAAIPDNVVEEMLDAAGRVVVRYHKTEISAQGLMKSGKLLGGITAVSKAGSSRNDWKRYVLVYPKGQHHTYQSRVVTRQYARSRRGRTYTRGGGAKVVSNSEVGFIQAYGAPRKGIRATDWMNKANAKAAPEVEKAELAVYDRWLKSLDL
jgi:hypothetical protein|uniref:HK97 gp10 family phage protein n=1 Tax=Myoviridae sp. cthmz15 TaxID=2826684 RepID=A0A8S5MGZ7_9CAUD|nr:MAG TPA: hypothetical protein [Myoviridae sp. cthmz15]